LSTVARGGVQDCPGGEGLKDRTPEITPLSLRISAIGRTHVGQVRRRNEDTMAVDPGLGILVVADGMGGAPGGDVASSEAVQAVFRGLEEGGEMREVILQANGKLLDMVREEPALTGMGTTLTALRVSAEDGRFVLGHVGDSRAYQLSGEDFAQLSRDHTMVRDMVDAGRIPASAERKHPLGHILSRALGTDFRVEVDLVEGSARSGDCFMLCSDGLMKVMTEEEVERWVRQVRARTLEAVVDGMVREANDRGAPDNVTVAMLALADASPEPS